MPARGQHRQKKLSEITLLVWDEKGDCREAPSPATSWADQSPHSIEKVVPGSFKHFLCLYVPVRSFDFLVDLCEWYSRVVATIFS